MKRMMMIGTATLLAGLWLAPASATGQRGRPAPTAPAQQCRDPYGRPVACTAGNARPVQAHRAPARRRHRRHG
jgi:hypothetical protein